MTTLYFKEGTSDKVYQANIVPNGDMYDVVFAYGRRGSTLTTGKKNTTPLSAIQASDVYNKLIREKMAKGYHEGEDAPIYTATDKEDRFTGILPMLLNPIDEDELDRLLDNDHWIAEEKYDGKRMLLRKNADGSVDAINRKGLIVGAPEVILAETRQMRGTFIIDGECIGDKYYAFDYIFDADLISRKHYLGYLLDSATRTHIVEVISYQLEGKRQLLADLKARNAEGIVFKNINGTYRAGRPASGGDGLKFKFYATASVRVTYHNSQRSVGIAVSGDETWIPCGNVTIPPNAEIPEYDSIIEVRYLYAYKESTNLYQPMYLGKRDDLTFKDCGVSQLKFKSGSEEEDDV